LLQRDGDRWQNSNTKKRLGSEVVAHPFYFLFIYFLLIFTLCKDERWSSSNKRSKFDDNNPQSGVSVTTAGINGGGSGGSVSFNSQHSASSSSLPKDHVRDFFICIFYEKPKQTVLV
jgi:hypothetical protein